MDDHEERPDGRTARRDRNRDAVLDAALDLFRDDALFPGPAEVAERSGVSTRSVQRYFADMDTLVRAAMARHLERTRPLFALEDPGVGPLGARIDRMVAARVRLHEAVAPMVRAALLRAGSNPIIRERITSSRVELREQVAAMFAPELDAVAPEVRAEVLAGLDLLLGFAALEHLCHDGGLSTEEADRVLRRGVTALLASAS